MISARTRHRAARQSRAGKRPAATTWSTEGRAARRRTSTVAARARPLAPTANGASKRATVRAKSARTPSAKRRDRTRREERGRDRRRLRRIRTQVRDRKRMQNTRRLHERRLRARRQVRARAELHRPLRWGHLRRGRAWRGGREARELLHVDQRRPTCRAGRLLRARQILTCMTGAIAYAFCIWDGGRLASSDEDADRDRANLSYGRYIYPQDMEVQDNAAYMNAPGRMSTGHGQFGHADLLGPVLNLVRDEKIGLLHTPGPSKATVTRAGSPQPGDRRVAEDERLVELERDRCRASRHHDVVRRRTLRGRGLAPARDDRRGNTEQGKKRTNGKEVAHAGRRAKAHLHLHEPRPTISPAFDGTSPLILDRLAPADQGPIQVRSLPRAAAESGGVYRQLRERRRSLSRCSVSRRA
jgi:hypothetical protein